MARLPEPYGLLIRSADRWDMTSLEFLDRLVHEPSRRVALAIETGRLPARSPVIDSLAIGAEQVPGVRPRARSPERVTAADRALALCPHGLPQITIAALQMGEPTVAERIAWPGGGEGVVLSPSRAARIRRSIRPDERSALHGAIFDQHPVTGWDYIRRAGHAIGSRDPERLLFNHLLQDHP